MRKASSMKRLTNLLSLAIVGVLVLESLVSQPVLAYTDGVYDEAQAMEFGAPHYDPNSPDVGLCGGATPGSTGTGVIMNGDTNFKKIASYFASQGLKDFAIAGILANLSNESNLSPFAIQGQPRNTATAGAVPSGAGYGIAQFTPSGKIGSVLQSDPRTSTYYNEYFSTKYGGYSMANWLSGGTGIPEGVTAEINDVWLAVQLDFFYQGEMQSTKVGTYRNMGGTMGLDYISSDNTILQALAAAQNEKDAARIFVWIYERPADKAGAASGREELATLMLPIVQEILSSGGFTSLTTPTGSAQLCVGAGSAAATGDFATTVKAFVWENGQRGEAQKPAYTQAIAGRPYKGGNNGNDCGAFVSALMVVSGFEPNYPGTNSLGQNTWLASNWTKVAGPGTVDVSQLQPGDVAYKPGHVFVWIGQIEGFAGQSAEAALGSNTAPTVILPTNTYSNPLNYTWYRKG